MVAEGLLRDGALGGKDAWLAFWRSCMGWLEPESLLVDLGTGHGRVMM